MSTLKFGLISVGVGAVALWVTAGLCAALFTDSLAVGVLVVLLCAAAVAVHELAHYFVLRWSGLPIVETPAQSSWSAALWVDDASWGTDPLRAVLVCVAGPVFGALVGLIPLQLGLATNGMREIVMLITAGVLMGDSLIQLIPFRSPTLRSDGKVALQYVKQLQASRP